MWCFLLLCVKWFNSMLLPFTTGRDTSVLHCECNNKFLLLKDIKNWTSVASCSPLKSNLSVAVVHSHQILILILNKLNDTSDFTGRTWIVQIFMKSFTEWTIQALWLSTPIKHFLVKLLYSWHNRLSVYVSNSKNEDQNQIVKNNQVLCNYQKRL